MIESEFLKKLKGDLIKRGFYYKKFADASTRGLPDSFLAKEGKGMFFEGKLIVRRYLPTELKSASTFITGKKKIQMMTLVEMDNHFFARYIIGIQVRTDLYVALAAPLSVFNLVEHDQPFFIKTFLYNDFLDHMEKVIQLG